MKKRVNLGWLLCLTCSWALAQTKSQAVPSNIERVIVFVSGAQINRTAKINLPSGKTELVFKDISPSIDKASIQVKGTGRFTVLSVTHQQNFLQEQVKREEITRLEAQKHAIQRQMTVEKSMLHVYEQEETMLQKNQQIGGNNVGVKTADLKEAVDFQRSRLTEILLKQLEIERTIADLDSTTKKLDRQLTALNQRKDLSTSEILVTVSAPEATAATFELSYLVKNAGWFVNYDLRVKDVVSPIDLSFKANVFQNSGEDWKEVKLTLSTGDPSESGVAPTLTPWRLRFGYAPLAGVYGLNANKTEGKISGRVLSADGEPLIGATILVKGTTVGTVTDTDGSYAIQIPPGTRTLTVSYLGFSAQEVEIGSSNIIDVKLEQEAALLEEVVVTGYGGIAGRAPGLRVRGISSKKSKSSSIPIETQETYQPTTVNFEIEIPYTILNDGKTYTVDIKAFEVPAIYEYYAAPKLDKDAFLTAKIADWQELNLLDGEVNLFFEGAFLGKSILDLRNASDTLEISLGRDKNVVIDRKKLKDYSKKQFVGNNRTEYRAFEITVRNNKQQPISITIEDQFPIGTTKDISVEKIEYKEAELEKDTDKLTWKLTLPARQENRMGFRYSVKYPKDEVLMLE